MVTFFAALTLQRQPQIVNEAGKECFIMIGNNLTYEPSFESLNVRLRN